MSASAKHLPGTRSGISQTWLEQLGFTSNPFAIREAGQEQELDAYFVEPPGFDQVRGAHTFLLFAPRGSGKTACRIMVERACRPLDTQSAVLAVPYYQALGGLVAELQRDWVRSGRQRHIEALLRQSMRVLYADLLARDSVPVHPDQLAILRGLIDQHAPDLLAPQNVLLELRKKNALRGDFDLRQALAAFKERRLGEALAAALSPNSRAGQILISLIDAPSLAVTNSALETFVDVARTFDVQSIFVMIDGLDEFPAQAPDVQDQVELLLPLLSDLGLVEHPFFKFKFFLPVELLSALQNCQYIRTDRLQFLSVSWTDNSLRRLLQQRLRAFSAGQVQSLAALFDDPSNAQDIDARLVRWAGGSPRTLLELTEELLTIHCRQYQPPLKLSGSDLEQLETRFQLEYAPQLIPPLRVDAKNHQVLIGNRPITKTTSPTEFKLLLFLYRHAGEIKSKDDIWREVYEYDEDGTSDVAIDSLVFRLRKKVEQDPGNPVYLKTVRGQGYRLLNTE